MSRPILGGALVIGGVFVTLIGGFVNLVNLSDEGPPCLLGCSDSFLRYYWIVFEATTLLVVVGIAVVAIGVRLLDTEHHPPKSNSDNAKVNPPSR